MTIDNKPLSPHITIYKPQITSVMSIMHRITGVVFFLGLLLILIAMTFHLYGCSCFFDLLQIITQTFAGKIISSLWLYAIFFHMLGGIRYLVWSCTIGLNIKTSQISGYFIIILAASLTGVCFYV